MRTAMRSVVAAAAVLGLSAFGASAAHAHSGDKTFVNVEDYDIVEVEVGYAHMPIAGVKNSKFVYIDQSATNVVFGHMFD